VSLWAQSPGGSLVTFAQTNPRGRDRDVLVGPTHRFRAAHRCIHADGGRVGTTDGRDPCEPRPEALAIHIPSRIEGATNVDYDMEYRLLIRLTRWPPALDVSPETSRFICRILARKLISISRQPVLLAATRCDLIQMLGSALTCANGCSCWSPDEENSPGFFLTMDALYRLS
jgi:hypothetical protein